MCLYWVGFFYYFVCGLGRSIAFAGKLRGGLLEYTRLSIGALISSQTWRSDIRYNTYIFEEHAGLGRFPFPHKLGLYYVGIHVYIQVIVNYMYMYIRMIL